MLSPHHQLFPETNRVSDAQSAPPTRHVGNRTRRHLPGGTEAVWTEELHAALLEALALYPPSARQRAARPGGRRGSKGRDAKGPGGPDADGGKKDGDGGSARVGRYQLIREFLRRKTGKVRSLQQIGSRMQHLRRAHARDAYMMALLRSDLECRKDGSGSASADGGSRPEKAGTQGRDASNFASAAYTPLGGPPFGPWTTLPPAGADALSSPLDPTAHIRPCKAPDGSSFAFAHPSLVPMWAEPSMSRRRLASNMPALQCQLRLPPASAFVQLLAADASRLDGAQASSSSASLGYMHSSGQAVPAPPLPGGAILVPASPGASASGGAGAAEIPRAGRRKSFCLNTEECPPPPPPSCLPPSVSASVSRTTRSSSSVVLGQSQLTNAQPSAIVRAAPPRDNKVPAQP